MTKKKMGLLLGAFILLWGVVLLALELWGYSQGVTISATLTSLWNSEPFVVLQIVSIVSFAWGCQVGHWFGRERPRG